MIEGAKVDLARLICARNMHGFCKNVGGGMGCPVGRGTSDYTKCVANEGQLALAGYTGRADEIEALVRGLCADEVKGFRECVTDSEDLETLEHVIRFGGIEP